MKKIWSSCLLLFFFLGLPGKEIELYRLDISSESLKNATGKNWQIRKVDGQNILLLTGRASVKIPLPKNLSAFANRRVKVSFTRKYKNVPQPEQSWNGVKVLTEYYSEGKRYYGHTKTPWGNGEWDETDYYINFKSQPERGMVIFSIPGGEAMFGSLKYSIEETSRSSSDETRLNAILKVPEIKEKPQIDGKISKGEWKDAAHDAEFISKRNGLLCGRKGEFFLGGDKQNIYFACRSQLPPASLNFSDKNAVGLMLEPEGKEPKKFLFSASGKHQIPDGVICKTGKTATHWEVEAVIPLAALGLSDMPWGKPWKFQVCRQWRDSIEQGLWNGGKNSDVPGTLIFEQGIPAISFEGLGRSPRYRFCWRCTNTTASPVEFRCEAERQSIENPISFVRGKVLKPGESHTFELLGMWATGTIRTMTMKLYAGKNELYRRQLVWDYMKSNNWQDGRSPVVFDIAVYPTYGKAKARLTSRDREKMKKIQSVIFSILDAEKHRTYFSASAQYRGNDWYLAWELPKLLEGAYLLTAEATGKDGKKTNFSRTFAIRTFPWQNNKIGMARIIVPPFKPLTVDKAAKRINATLTGFRPEGAFWKEIYAQGENILSSPIMLRINGEPIRETQSEFQSIEPDRVIRKAELTGCGMKISAVQDYDYDGFCKLTLKFTPPREGANLQKMVLDIPLQAKYARFMHSTIGQLRRNVSDRVPEGSGTVWQSTQVYYPELNRGNFRPYFWLGEFYKGLSWVCESPKNWSMRPGKATQEVIRAGNTVILRIHIINQTVKWTGPKEIVMAFQPTPVKPQPEGFRKLCGVMYQGGGLRFDNTKTLRISNTTWRGCSYSDFWNQIPPNGDWSWSQLVFASKGKKLTPEFRKDIEQKAKAFIEKNHWIEKKFGIHSPEKSLVQGVMHNRHTDIYEAYFNPRLLSKKFPEYEVFADEWNNDAWRSEKDVDEYNIITDKNYQDFLLWSVRENLRHGWQVVNFDNSYDINDSDDICGLAEEIAPGRYRSGTSFFALRELIKRTAVLLYQEKKMLCGYPALTVHITNSLIPPMHSFAAATIDWEMNYGGQDYQDRFPRRFTYPESLGTQTGTIPIVLIQSVNDTPDWVARTILATTFGYDLLHYRDGTSKIPPFFVRAINLVRNFGYGDPGVAVYPGWHEDNPVKLSGADALATTVIGKDQKSALILIGGFGPAGILKLDVSRLGMRKPSAINAETGKPVGSGQLLGVALPKKEYKILLIRESNQ